MPAKARLIATCIVAPYLVDILNLRSSGSRIFFIIGLRSRRSESLWKRRISFKIL